MIDKKTIRFIAEHRGTLSKNRLAKKLGMEKRDVVDILKKLDRGRVGIPKGPSRLSDALERAQNRFFSSQILPLSFLFLLGLLLRGSFLFAIRHDPLAQIPILDAAYYLRWAEAILHHETFFHDAYFVEPGYAFLLAGALKLFGSTLPVLILQTILGSMSAVFVFLASLRATGKAIPSFFAGLFIAISGPLVFHDSLLLKTSVEFFLLSLSSFLMAVTWTNPKRSSFFVLGVILGLTAIFKTNILYAAPLLAIAIFFALPETERRFRTKMTGFLLLGIAIVISPVSIRNTIKSHAFVPINASGGPNLYIGNWEGADGTLKPPEFVSVNPDKEEESWKAIAESYTHRVETLPEVSSFWTNRAISEALSAPMRFFTLSAKKFILLFHVSEFDDNANRTYAYPLFPPLRFLPGAWIGAIMGLFGVLLFLVGWKRFSPLLPLLALGAGYAATLIGSHVTERYRLALLPFFLPFAAFAMSFIADAWRKRSFEKFFFASIPILLFSILAFLPTTASRTGVTDMYANFAKAAKDKGNTNLARAYYEDGLRADPNHIPSKTGLADTELRLGNADRAIALYREAILIQWELPTDGLSIAMDLADGKISPKDAQARLDSIDTKADDIQYDADFIEGMKFFRNRDFKSALPFFERAHTAHPENESALANLATAYKNTKQLDLAEKLFLKILEDHPANLPVRYNLANLYLGKKSVYPAIQQLEEINSIVPGYYTTRIDLAQVYLKTGNKAKATDHLRLFIDESRNVPGREPLIREAQKLLDSIKNTPLR